MMGFGILAGLAAALFQSGGYIFSRIYIRKGGRAFPLAVLAQLWIALFSLPLLAVAWQDGFWGNWQWLWPLFGTVIGTTGGEIMFFRAEENIAPSRLSSLLGLRVAVLAIASAILGLERYNLWQVGAIGLAAVSAAVMNYRNGRIEFKGMGFVFTALAFYCLSDLSIKFMIDGIAADTLWRRSLLAVAALNLVAGAAMLPFLRFLRLKRADFPAAAPYAGSWFVKQIFLYLCYAAVGPVFGNVIMAARGPIAIVLTLLLLHLGVHHLEKPKGGGVWLQRGVATLMMAAAIILYSLA